MSYTAPAGNAASVSWLGAVSYTAPAGNAVSVTWETGGSVTSTRFGTPAVARGQRAVGASVTAFGFAHVKPIQHGDSVTVYGIPYGISHQKLQGIGFVLAQFGTPSHARAQSASGSLLPTYGASIGTQHWDAPSLGPITSYGAVFHAYTFAGQTTGLADTNFGHPVAFRVTPGDIGINTDTYAIYSTGFGTHNAAYALSGTAVGLASSQYGTHEARRAGTATGTYSTLFGAHSATFKSRAAGTRPTAYGTPSSTRIVPAIAISPRARFGAPYIWRSNTFPVYGINDSGKFGQPRGYSRHNHPATGFFSGYFGLPSCRERSRATHIPPGSAFGTPLLKRALTC